MSSRRPLFLDLVGEVFHMKSLDLVEILPQVFLVPHQQPLIGSHWLAPVHVQVFLEILILLSSLFEKTILVLYGFLRV